MNKTLLAKSIRDKADVVNLLVDPNDLNYEDNLDTVELLRALARIIDGKPLERAFGYPGDWGYETPIGRALDAKA